MRKLKLKIIFLACGLIFPHAISADISGVVLLSEDVMSFATMNK